MTTEEKLEKAMSLLERAADRLSDDTSPDVEWWTDWFELTGEHMILTDEGWEPGSIKAELIEEYGFEAILDEVNAPEVEESNE